MERKAARVIVLAACLMAVVAGAGCRQVAKKAVEEATGVKVEDGGASVVVKTDEGEAKIESGKKLPEGFPASFPVYAGEIESTGSFSQGESRVYNVIVRTDDDIDRVKEFYLKELPAKGWTIGMTADVGTASDRGVTITAETDELSATVVAKVASGGGVEISIMVGTKQ